MSISAVRLDDKYEQEEGRVFMTGMQALVRLPMLQRQRDVAAGLNTAGFISGYRGSPLGVMMLPCGRLHAFSPVVTLNFNPV